LLRLPRGWPDLDWEYLWGSSSFGDSQATVFTKEQMKQLFETISMIRCWWGDWSDLPRDVNVILIILDVGVWCKMEAEPVVYLKTCRKGVGVSVFQCLVHKVLTYPRVY
jgi:hypothetical protein